MINLKSKSKMQEFLCNFAGPVWSPKTAVEAVSGEVAEFEYPHSKPVSKIKYAKEPKVTRFVRNHTSGRM